MLIHQLHLPHEPIWLDQTHSTRCVRVEQATGDRLADAAVTTQRQFPLAILTADCLPIVICNQPGTEIAAIHAGWRGLAGGIIENTLQTMTSPPATCMAWIGPSICGQCYQTGTPVFEQFTARYPYAEPAFFTRHHPENSIDSLTTQPEHLYLDLAYMAELILLQAGLASVTQSKACTFESDAYYSYRKAAQTGRIATLIWFQSAF
jgi:YfiH family protein